MLRSSLFAAVSLFALGACQPAAEAPEELVAETPPPVAEDVVAEAETAPSETVAVEPEAAPEADDHDHEEEHDHATEEGHDHENHDHADEEAHDDHDHESHDHDDHDHDHAGGEAHVHGLSELAVSLDGARVSVSLEGALANFGVDETLRTLDNPADYTDTVIALEGGECTRDSASASIRPVGDHGNMMLDMVYTCAAIESLEALTVTGFESFAGFEQVNAVVLTETGQSASTLTAESARLDLK